LISLVALAVIVFGISHQVMRERLRHADCILGTSRTAPNYSAANCLMHVSSGLTCVRTMMREKHISLPTIRS
jgi:hypothetical protein